MKNRFAIDREDMLALTRRMNAARNCFMRVAGCYLDRDGEIEDTFNVNFLNLPPAEREKVLAAAKAVPFGDTNRQLRGFLFPEGSMGKGSFHQLLCGILDCELKNDLLLEVLYEQIASSLRDPSDMAVFVTFGSYDVKDKARDGIGYLGSESVYNFLIVSICRYFSDYSLDEPVAGFLFPAFYEQAAGVNAVCIYDRSPAAGEEQLRRKILGC